MNVYSGGDRDQESKLSSIFELFALNQRLELKILNSNNEQLSGFFARIDSKYKKIKTIDQDEVLVDFGKILTDLKLNANLNYDSNLKICKTNDLNQEILSVYEEFSGSKSSYSRILYLCTNAEYFQRQKLDLLFRSVHFPDHLTSKFICIGNVKTDSNENNDSIQYNYELREKYFRYSAKQRQMLSNDLNQFNVKNLTLFSIVYDLFGTNHQNDFSKFKVEDFLRVNLENDDAEDDEDFYDEKCLKISEQSSFILYNCARLNAIIQKFENLVQKGKCLISKKKWES